MATVSQNLQANVRFGGNIDPSWNRSVSGLKEGLSGLSRESAKLTSQQKKLSKQIKEGMLAGKDVSNLRQQYERLDQQIRRTTTDQEGMNKALARAERLDRWRGRGRSMIAGTGRVAGGIARWGTAGLLAGAAGAIASPIAMNQETAEQAGMARTYGVDIETMKAWGSIARQAGMDAEGFGDLFEEFRNKVSEYKSDPKTGALHDVLPELNFKAGDLAGKNNQEQVEEIFDRLLKMDDEQYAAGLADSLFGGEANKLLTFMRMSGQSYSELMAEQKRYNLTTKEGADGAIEGNKAFNNLWSVFTTGAQEISGALGKELAPAIGDITDDLAGWFKGGGIEKVKNLLTDDIYPAIASFVNGLLYVGKIIFAVAKKLSWILPDEEASKKTVLKTLGQMGSEEIAKVIAKREGVEPWFEEQLKANPNLRNDVVKDYSSLPRGLFGVDSDDWSKKIDERYKSMSGNSDSDQSFSTDFLKSLLSSDAPELKSALRGTEGMSGRSGPQLTQTNHATFEIYQSPGEPYEGFAQRIANENKGLERSNGQNILGDMAEGWGG